MPKILLVDNTRRASSIRTALENAGHEVVHANGVGMISSVMSPENAAFIQLVICQDNLERVGGGVWLAALLRRGDILVPFILLCDDESKHAATDLGTLGVTCVSTSTSPKELAEKVNGVLE